MTQSGAQLFLVRPVTVSVQISADQDAVSRSSPTPGTIRNSVPTSPMSAVRDVQLRVVEPHGEGSAVVQTTNAAFRRKPGLARWLYPMLARKTFRDQFERLTKTFS